MNSKSLSYIAMGVAFFAISISFHVLTLSSNTRKQQPARELIVAYGDSVLVEQQNMLKLITEINATTDNPSQRMKAFSEAIDERTAINKRRNKYQWKVDSLKMVLNK